jgi:hypothetical protein
VTHLFQEDVNLLDETKRILDEEKKIIEMEVIIRWMRRDRLSDAQIEQSLLEMGYTTENAKQQLSLTYTCPKCNDLLRYDSGTDYICGKCKITVCHICICEKDAEHICDDNVLLTLKKIQSTCVACPKCNVVIEKEPGGCDQMFCVECKTTFSWKTGRIVSSSEVHHNPHFYEWQRQQKPEGERNQLDNPCEGHFLIKCQEELVETIDNNEGGIIIIDKGIFLKFIQGVVMHSIETIFSIQEREDYIRQQLRARYLSKRMTYKKWKRCFKQHVNTLRRNNEIKTLLMTCLDGLYYVVIEENANTDMIDNLFQIITENLKDVQRHYNNTKCKTINYLISTEQVVLPYMI